jgi:hypothetical protein
MTLYQKKLISTGETLGPPGPLPDCLIGDLQDDHLQDLSWITDPDLIEKYELSGAGFFRVEPDPPQEKTFMPKIDFLRLFTQSERIAIRTAAKTNAQIEDYQDMLNAATVVSLQDEDMISGIPLLEAAGLIGPGRAAQVLAGEPSSG